MRKKNLLMWAIAVLMLFAGYAFAEEVQKGPKVLVKEKEVQFLDETGKVSKKVSLESKTKLVTETRQVGNTKKTYKFKQEIYSNAKASANGKFVGISENTMDIAVLDEKGEEKEISEGQETGKIKLIDTNGKTIFEKQLPEGRGAGIDPLISDNGEVVTIITWDTVRETDDPKNIIFVFDRRGNEILSIPSPEERKNNKNLHVIGAPEDISPNGKYLAIEISYGYGAAFPTITRFYNLKNKKYWDSGKSYAVYEISDKGMVKAATSGSAPTEYIDLNNYLGD